MNKKLVPLRVIAYYYSNESINNDEDNNRRWKERKTERDHSLNSAQQKEFVQR